MIGEPTTLILSPRVTVTVAELDGFELDKVDSIVSERTTPIDADTKVIPLMEMGFKQPRIYGICSIRSFNGETVMPSANLAEYANVAKRLGSTELRALAKWAQPVYAPDEDDSKKEAEAAPSEV